MRRMLALAGWPELVAPPGSWTGTDPAARTLVLAHIGAADTDPVPVAANEGRTVRAVLAGAVYNRRELRTSLAGRHAFSGRDDAEVVVHLYEERGVQGLKALRGAFAVALWDSRRHQLVLVRDQLGLVPLYYAAHGGRLAAASTLPALTALPGLAGAWDAAALDALLVLGTVPPPATLHPAIRQLHPGEAAVWEDGRLRGQRYWQLAFPERRLGCQGLGGVVREQVTEAVRLRQTGAPAGLFLSGGLASATLLTVMIRAHRPPAKTYSAALPDAEEIRAAARLALPAGVEHVVLADAPDWPLIADHLLDVHGDPAGGLEAGALGLLAARAASDGQIALAGVGGEEIFGGSLPARAAEHVRRYRRLPGSVREVAELWARLAPRPVRGAIGRVVQHARMAPVELYARTVSRFMPEERERLYTPEALEALGDAQPWAALTTLFADAVSAGATDAADAIHYVEVALRLPARAVVAAAVADRLDLRLPLADHRLAQLVATAPVEERSGTRGRHPVLSAALTDLLPRPVLHRRHTSPVPPPAAWLTGGLRALVEETLAPERLASQGVFRPDMVALLRREHEGGRYDHGVQLWAILLATRWLARRTLPVAGTLRATA